MLTQSTFDGLEKEKKNPQVKILWSHSRSRRSTCKPHEWTANRIFEFCIILAARALCACQWVYARITLILIYLIYSCIYLFFKQKWALFKRSFYLWEGGESHYLCTDVLHCLPRIAYHLRLAQQPWTASSPLLGSHTLVKSSEAVYTYTGPIWSDHAGLLFWTLITFNLLPIWP